MTTPQTDVCTMCGDEIVQVEGRWSHPGKLGDHPPRPHSESPWLTRVQRTDKPLPARPENATPEAQRAAHDAVLDRKRQSR